jgi:hypothetical protein
MLMIKQKTYTHLSKECFNLWGNLLKEDERMNTISLVKRKLSVMVMKLQVSGKEMDSPIQSIQIRLNHQIMGL